MHRKFIFAIFLLAGVISCQTVESFVENEPDSDPAEEPVQSAKPIETQVQQRESVDISIKSIPNNADEAFAIFEKYVNVFGVNIYASASVPDEKLMHAASVMAEYLDNDEDGQPDNPDVINAMTSQDATLVMFGRDGDPVENDFFELAEPLFESGVALQNLYAAETLPNGGANGEFDATLEEVLHLITMSGYANAYPAVWGEEPGTEVANAMDIARGGRFMQIPASYPSGAWYTYDDETCEYNCMIAEYVYWSLTSILGAQDFPGRFEQIGHEWKLNTADKVRSGDPSIYEMLSDPEYRFPTQLPDGDYLP